MRSRLSFILFLFYCLGSIFCEESEKVKEQAMNFLLKTEVFANTHSGSGRISFEGNAYSVIKNSKGSYELFREIYKNAKTAGKIYALIGLYDHDVDFVKNEIETMSSQLLSVNVQDSCCIKSHPVASILKNTHPRTVRLTDSSPNIPEWLKNNPGQGAYPDVFGGSYSEIFNALSYDSRVAFVEHALTRKKPLAF